MQYKVLTIWPDTHEAPVENKIEEACNEIARDGWRLVSTAALPEVKGKGAVFCFFERAVE